MKEFESAIKKALKWLDRDQEPQGYWTGNLESNSCMEAQWIMGLHFMGVNDCPNYNNVIQAILDEQREDGSWEIYYRAETGDINTTVECYAALKCAGHDPAAPHMKKAREWILKRGGLKNIRVFTKYWLALLGEWPWEHTPNLPPEIIFQPSWMPFSIYRFASWARATIMPLSLLCSDRPSRPLPEGRRLDELFPEGRENFDFRIPRKKMGICYESFFMFIDRILNSYVNAPWKPFRRLARKTVVEWIIKHQDGDGIWGGIQPPTIYSLMALYNEGYLMTHPVLARCLKAFNGHWSYKKKNPDATYVKASESPVWDTMLSIMAQADCGLLPKESASMSRGIDWLSGMFLETPGDWQVYVKGVQPGAWAFEMANTWYPDVDDTAVALIVLARLYPFIKGRSGIKRQIELGFNWLKAMQSDNGGWGAFDRDNSGLLVTKIPFCDFGEALDPPSVDVTAHVLEAFGLLGMKKDDPVAKRALRYIRDEQEPGGSWFGRWGVNHIYGTAAVLPALRAIGEDMTADWIVKAADWVASVQNMDGGWGETCASYMDYSLIGRGVSTASQTGWAIMALVATGSRRYDHAIRRGLEWLVETQQDDGTWDEPWYTGTGFPGYGVGERTAPDQESRHLDQGVELSRGFMINYNMYRHYFPLMAMGRALKHLAME